MAARLKAGAIFVTFTKGLNSPHFEVLDRRRYKMSWGPATVFIHRRVHDSGQALPPYRFNLLPSDSEEYNGEDILSDDDEEDEEEYEGSSSDDAYADEKFEEEEESDDEDDVEEDSTNGMFLHNSAADGSEGAEELQVETAAKRQSSSAYQRTNM